MRGDGREKPRPGLRLPAGRWLRQRFELEEVVVKRERMLQVAVGLLGLLYVGMIIPLYRDLVHSSWLLEQKNECDPMFLSFFIPVGIFLLIAARRPSEHRSMIARS